MGERGGGGGGGEWIRPREAGAPSRFREGFDGEGMEGGWEESHSIADRCICQSVADVSASFYVVTRLVVIIAHFYFLATVTPPVREKP